MQRDYSSVCGVLITNSYPDFVREAMVTVDRCYSSEVLLGKTA